MAKTSAKTKIVSASGIFYPIVAALSAILSIVAMFVPLDTFTKGYVVERHSIFDRLTHLGSANDKIFGLIPSYVPSGIMGTVTTGALYMAGIVLITAIVFAVLAIFLKKQAPIFTCVSVFLSTWAIAGYVLSVLIVSSYHPSVAITIDYLGIVLSILSAGLYLAVMIKLLKTEAILNAIYFLLTLLFTGLVFLALTYKGSFVSELVNSSKVYESALLLACVFLMINLFASSVLALLRTGLYLDLILSLAEILIVIGICYVSTAAGKFEKSYVVLSLIASLVTIAEIFITVLHLSYSHKNELEEMANVMIEKSEEETETANEKAAIAKPNQEALACLKEEDEFIKTLSDMEKSDFAELYILKSKGTMAEIPDYQIGGDNKDFFNKVFIYLGQYRAMIPSELLSKIYDYSMSL